MSSFAREADRRPGLVAAAVAAAGAWLLRPAEERRSRPAPTEAPVVLVAGLAPRCGATVVARGLGAALARTYATGVAVVVTSETDDERSVGSGALARGAAGRTARDLAENGLSVRAVGQVALVAGSESAAVVDVVRAAVPVVIDRAAGAGAEGAATLADAVVLVAPGSAEPALAAVVAGGFERLGPVPLVAANRAEGEAWTGRADVILPDARAAARVALAGRRPTGALGRALDELASRVSEA